MLVGHVFVVDIQRWFFRPQDSRRVKTMFLVEYLLYFILTLVLFGVVVLSFAVVPYQGVISLMGISFFCCVAMVVMGRTYAALVIYIVYLGGLVVVFGYCVSVEKGGEVVIGISGF